MLPIIQTNRLRLRPLNAMDLPYLITMNQDPDVMRYIGDGKTKSIEHAKNFLHRVLNLPDNGFGLWGAEQLSDEKFIGWFALNPLDGRPEIEIGYRLLKDFWGKGYATEGSLKLMEYGFQKMNLKQISAVTHPENLASQRVLKKCGLKRVGETFAYGGHCFYFKT